MLIIILGDYAIISAQSFQSGIIASSGKYIYDHSFTGGPFGNPFDKNNGDYFNFGVDVKYEPTKERFQLHTGIVYLRRVSPKIGTLEFHRKYHFIKVPIGVDFYVGEKIGFIIGPGLYGTYLLNYSSDVPDQDFDESHRPFQFGVDLGFGFFAQIIPQISLVIKYQNSIDLSYLYIDTYTYKFGGETYYKIRSFDSYISLSCHYKWNM